jgi:ferredoxin like protein
MVDEKRTDQPDQEPDGQAAQQPGPSPDQPSHQPAGPSPDTQTEQPPHGQTERPPDQTPEQAPQDKYADTSYSHSPNESLGEKLYGVRYTTDETDSHLKVKDRATCRECERKPCMARCPAEVYRWQEAGQLLEVAYENCLECGVCRLVCPYDNIDWRYPRGGYGHEYKAG